MEFWGIELKSGEPLKVLPGDGMILHLSQACLGEPKKEKGNKSVCLFVNVDGKKLVLGTLFTDKLPQQQFDLVFDRDFELSHNWTGGSVYFYGYKCSNPLDDEMPGEEFDDSESDEGIPLTLPNNGRPERAVAAKEKKTDAGKHKVKIVEPNKTVKPLEDDDDDSEVEKRSVEYDVKTPVHEKKARVTLRKTDRKKGGDHVDTPHPAKQAGKAPGQQNKQTPKSGGSHSCKSCNRTFGSEQALESHSKAKHSVSK